jgi:hypothetical protein
MSDIPLKAAVQPLRPARIGVTVRNESAVFERKGITHNPQQKGTLDREEMSGSTIWLRLDRFEVSGGWPWTCKRAIGDLRLHKEEDDAGGSRGNNQ